MTDESRSPFKPSIATPEEYERRVSAIQRDSNIQLGLRREAEAQLMVARGLLTRMLGLPYVKGAVPAFKEGQDQEEYDTLRRDVRAFLFK